MRAVMCAVAAAGLLFGVESAAQGQDRYQLQTHDSTKIALIHQLLTNTHAVDLAVSTIETGISTQRAANPRIPAAFWDRFMVEVRNRRGEFEDMVTDVYANHFTPDELRQIIAFYQTPVGQKMVAELPAVTQESMQAGREWGARLGASVAKELQSEGTPPGS